MPAVAVPAPLPHLALEGADWSDRFETTVAKDPGSAENVARLLFSRMPYWVKPLLALRNILVLPLGLKGASAGNTGSNRPAEQMVGFFPIVLNSPEQTVLGFDDKHLDFRVVVDVLPEPQGRYRVGEQTIIRRNNFAGRAYLFVIMPFHRVIVKASMARLIGLESS